MAAKIRPDTLLAGRYRVKRSLGHGGMGEVFAAENTRTGRVVAVKVLRAERRTDSAVERFRREARAAGSVQSDHVTEVIDVDEDAEFGILLVFELLEGESLIERLERTGPLPFAELHPLVEQLWLGLVAAHRVGVVHRDLKPSNIFLERRPDGSTRVKILDFGISKLPRELGVDSLTKTGQSLGTFSFMPPEQVEMSRNVDHRADIYSAGTLVFQALTGKLPFVASNLVLLLELKTRARAARLSDVSPIPVDPRLDAFVAKALERRMEDRFSSATEALEAWRALRSERSEDTLEAPASGRGTLQMKPAAAPAPPQRDPRLPALLDACGFVRRLTPEVLLDLLGRVSTPPISDLAEARTLWWQLSRENHLFLSVPEAGAIVLRADLRKKMLARAHAERPDDLRGMHARAAYWYALRPDASDRADVVYHFLCLGLTDEAEQRWSPSMAGDLVQWLADLPANARTWLEAKIASQASAGEIEEDPTTRRQEPREPAPKAVPSTVRIVLEGPARSPEPTPAAEPEVQPLASPGYVTGGAPASPGDAHGGAPPASPGALGGAPPAPLAPPVGATLVHPPAPPASPAPAAAPPQAKPITAGPPPRVPDAEPPTQPLVGSVRTETVALLEGAMAVHPGVTALWVPRVEGGRASRDGEGNASGSRGTAFYVAPDLVLTALYVVRARRPGDTFPDDADFAEQARGATLDGERRCRALVAHSDSLGYALLEVAPDPRHRPLPLRTLPFVGGRASVIHFPSGVKTVVFTQASAPSRGRIEYLADGSRGWYGAPLFDGEWSVVGVDWGARVREGVSLRLSAAIVDVLADLAQRFPAVHARLSLGARR